MNMRPPIDSTPEKTASSARPAVRFSRLLLRGAAGLIGAFFVSAALVHADTSFNPVADSYIRNSTLTTNYGTQSTIVCNNANGIRVMYLKFDLSSITAPITRLQFNITATTGNAGNIFNVYGLTSGESWTETGITWSNAPGIVQTNTNSGDVLANTLKASDLSGSGTVLASFASAVSGTVNVFDVTSGPVLNFVNADSDKVVTFVIAEADPSDQAGDIFDSREASSGKPTLTVSTDPQTAPTAPSIIQVVLQGGQSNSDGRAAGSGLPAALQAPQPDILFYYYTYGAAANGDGTLGTLTTLRPGATQMPSGGFGPEVQLGHDLAPFVDGHSNNKLAIIKYAKGGSNLFSDWKPGGDGTTTNDGVYYNTFQTVMKNGLAKLQATYPTSTIRIVGMIWVQGESDIDAGDASSNAYGSNLTQFISDVRDTFGTSIPFFFSRLSSSQTFYSLPSDSTYADYLVLRQQQALAGSTIPRAYMIDTDSTAFTMNSDGLHFNAAGQQAMGSAFATKISQVLGANSYETENLTVANFLSAAGGRAYVLPTDSNLSNSDGTALESANAGDYVTYTIPSVAAGTYNVRVGIKKNTSRGIFQLQASPANDLASAVNVGSNVDEYGSAAYTEVDLGSWTATTAGDKWFRFNVVGKNGASTGTSYNYAITFDYITLTPDATPAPALLAPASGLLTSSPLSVSYTLPVTASANSLTLTFTGATTKTLTLASSQAAAGPHAFSFDPRNPLLGSQVAAGSAIPDGTYSVTLGLQDPFGHTLGTSSVSGVVIDTTPPVLTSVSLGSNNANPARARAGDTVTLNFTVAESTPTPTVSLLGAPATVTNVSGNQWTASATVGSGAIDGPVTFSLSTHDAAGNAATATATTDASSVIVDNTPPSFVSVSGNLTAVAPDANGVAVTYTAATANDNFTSSPAISYNKASGTVFPLGTTTVTATAVDEAGNSASASFTVTVLTGVQNWRQQYFGTTSNTGSAADDADPYQTGVENLMAFALFGPNQDPALINAGQLPILQTSGGSYYFSFTTPDGVGNVTFGAQWSSSLDEGSWQSIPDTGSGNVHTFVAPTTDTGETFMRLIVTTP